MDKKIVQLVPVPLRAVYRMDDGSGVFSWPLLAALHADGGVGLYDFDGDGMFDIATDTSNFVGLMELHFDGPRPSPSPKRVCAPGSPRRSPDEDA